MLDDTYFTASRITICGNNMKQNATLLQNMMNPKNMCLKKRTDKYILEIEFFMQSHLKLYVHCSLNKVEIVVTSL